MTSPNDTNTHVVLAIEIAVKLGILVLLLGWCFLILKPFISPVVWGIIMAVAAYPLSSRLSAKLGNRPKLAAAIITIAALLLIILPTIKLAASMIDGVKSFNEELQSGSIHLPQSSAGVKDWPIIGPSIEKVWREASVNLMSTLERHQEQLRTFGSWLVKKSLTSGMDLILFTFSIIIAGVLLAVADSGGRVARSLFVRMAGRRGADFAKDAVVTIRNVVKGILGVAIIQALLAGIGFGVAGVPAAGLWAFLCLLLAIIQIGVGPVVIPIIIFMFYTASTLKAAMLAGYLVLVLLSDNFLKPILLGRGAPVPMPVIFLGTIGGFLSMGFLGLFVGAIVLSLGYKLFETWVAAGGEGASNPELW